MRSWTGQKAWKDWSGKLAVAEGDHFEREVLPLLRFIWPGMTQARGLKAWTHCGIDLFVWSDQEPFPCAVQCKGFTVQEIGTHEIRLIEDSIQNFLSCNTRVDTYLVAHNRDGRNRELAKRIDPLLDQIVATGKARRAEMWARHQIVTNLFKEMETRIEEKLHQRSAQLLDLFSRLFRFGNIYVTPVPATTQQLTFRRDAPCSASRLGPSEVVDIPALIEKSSGTHWTMLTGQFGTGKTTSAMRAAAAATRPIVLVPAATVPTNVFKQGNTNGLTQHVIDSLQFLADEDEQRLFGPVAGAVLSYFLRHGESPFVFVLDGLDEHHFFSSLEGLQRLANQLAEFSAAVVLTTRREHLDALLGDFNIAFSDLGQRFGRERIVDTIELQPWTEAEVRTLVEGAIKEADVAERNHLVAFRARLNDGTVLVEYGDLIYHPLFLHFILEDVVNDGISHQTRPSLLRRWLGRKLRRDRAVWAPGTVESRPTLDPHLETEEFIRRMSAALEDIAFLLSEPTSSGVLLRESAPAQAVADVVQERFPDIRTQLLPILLNSILVIHSRNAEVIRVGFALRTFHEYLAAAYLSRNSLSASAWPETVRVFERELSATTEREPMPEADMEIVRASVRSRAVVATTPVNRIWDRAMYNLFVSSSPSAWGGSPFLLERERFLEYTDPEIKKIVGDLGAGAVNRIVRMPCVFAYEAVNEKDPLFGVVRRVVGRDRNIRVEYEVVPVAPFLTQAQFVELAPELAIEDFEFHRNHWAVKEVDLGRVLAKANITLPPADVWLHPVNVATHQFDVGLSFPGEVRPYVKAVAGELESLLGSDRYFYDNNYKSQLARPDLDLLLQDIYQNRSRLVVVFLSEAYENKPWCSGVEFRAIREIIKSRDQQRIMFVRTDDGAVKGTFTIDGAVDARHHSPQEIARMIKQRVDVLA